jgi:hypothetical protein
MSNISPELAIFHDNVIDSIRELSETEYTEYTAADARLKQLEQDQALFTTVLLNYGDFEKTLQKCLREYISYSFVSLIEQPPISGMMLDINRRILNLLSAFRTYLDHSQYNLSKRYGAQSERLQRFNIACSAAYDGDFSYRFAYELRNYVQHCGMPLGVIELKAEPDKISKTVTYSLEVYFDRDALLDRFDWKSQLRVEIAGLASRFPIRPHMAELMRSLEQINRVALGDELDEIARAAQIVQRLTTLPTGKVGRPCIVRERPTAPKGRFVIEWIPTELVGRVLAWGNAKSLPRYGGLQ